MRSPIRGRTWDCTCFGQSSWFRQSYAGWRWAVPVSFLHLSVFGCILLGAWPPLKLFSERFPWRYLCSRRMVLSAHFCQVLQPGSWYGSGFSGSVCLNRPYAVWFVIGPDRAAFLAWHVWYIVPKAWKAHAALSEPMTENVSGYSRNLVLWIGNETKRQKKKQERGSSYKLSIKTQFNQGKALNMKGSWVWCGLNDFTNIWQLNIIQCLFQCAAAFSP